MYTVRFRSDQVWPKPALSRPLPPPWWCHAATHRPSASPVPPPHPCQLPQRLRRFNNEIESNIFEDDIGWRLFDIARLRCGSDVVINTSVESLQLRCPSVYWAILRQRHTVQPRAVLTDAILTQIQVYSYHGVVADQWPPQTR